MFIVIGSYSCLRVRFFFLEAEEASFLASETPRTRTFSGAGVRVEVDRSSSKLYPETNIRPDNIQ